jgi:hypothetical protein
MTASLDSVAGGRRAAVRDAIAQAASSTGVDFGYLLAQARSESGLDPTARAGGSSAAGLFQFIDQSWLGVLKKHGADYGMGWAANAIGRSGGRWHVTDPSVKQAIFALRQDPTASSLMAGAYAGENASGLSQALGRQPNATDLYMAHFLGLKGASRFLQAADATPQASAAALFPREAGANAGIFYAKGGAPRSLSEVYALMARKLDGAGETVPVAPDQDGGQAQLAMADATAGKDDVQASFPSINDVLRPDPKHAMLAYRMIAASLL